MVRSMNPAEGKDIVQVLYPSTCRFERYGAGTFLFGCCRWILEYIEVNGPLE